ncbi:uncharacterized protein VTP21DRAFT_3999 [Calcarisporiella thermophila]|uniref:uncharacterized protein n=1 Tax=Calcarisporiella thermophila TaxID=911321 RepID=UPI0037443449
MWNLSTIEKSLVLATAILVAFATLYATTLDNEDFPASYQLAHVRVLVDRDALGQQASSNSSQWCVDPECLLAAAGIMQDMDTTVNPCEDFYSYSCGGWIKSHPIPQDKSQVSVFDLLSDNNKETLRDVLEGQFTPINSTQGDVEIDKDNFNKFKAIYTACMNETNIEQLKANPILPVVKIVTDNLPLAQPLPLYFTGQPVSGQPIDKAALSRTLGKMSENGADGLVGLSVDADALDPEVNVLYMSSSGISLPSKDYYSEADVLALYRTTIGDTFRLILGELAPQIWPNTPIPADAWNQMADEVVKLETALANVSLSPEQSEDPVLTYNPTAFTDLAQQAPNLDWTLFAQTWLEGYAEVPPTAVIDAPNYMRSLSNEILPKTPSPTIVAYLLWRLLDTYSSYLHISYQRPIRRLNQKLTGVNADVLPPRWRTCLGIINSEAGQGAGRYFVLRKFGGNSKEMAEGLVESLKTIFKQRLPQLDWLDEATRQHAIEKVDKLDVKVGYSAKTPDVMSPASIQEYYKNLTTSQEAFLDNALSSARFINDKAKERLGKPVDKSLWQMNPQTVNAYYNPTGNEIVFPAGILQPPFFNVKLPEYLNFGGVGVVIGHELTHAFDNHGRLFDQTGKMADWWTNATAAAFEQKTQCFISEYGNFTIKSPEGADVHVNGNLTLGENLADNGGLGESFLTWQARMQSDPQMQTYNNRLLPGLDHLSREQLYFVSFARVWCSHTKPEKLLQQVRTDPHSPSQYRVNGAVVNSPLFARAFNCPAGSPMNPSSKCEIW